jgi:hypothetical protein
VSAVSYAKVAAAAPEGPLAQDDERAEAEPEHEPEPEPEPEAHAADAATRPSEWLRQAVAPERDANAASNSLRVTAPTLFSPNHTLATRPPRPLGLAAGRASPALTSPATPLARLSVGSGSSGSGGGSSSASRGDKWGAGSVRAFLRELDRAQHGPDGYWIEPVSLAHELRPVVSAAQRGALSAAAQRDLDALLGESRRIADTNVELLARAKAMRVVAEASGFAPEAVAPEAFARLADALAAQRQRQLEWSSRAAALRQLAPAV